MEKTPDTVTDIITDIITENPLGYEWGWISEGGDRGPSNGNTLLLPKDIIGVWGRLVGPENTMPTYLESFLSENVPKDAPADSIWRRKPLATLLKLNMGEIYRLDNMDDRDLTHAIDIFDTPKEEKKSVRTMQKWKCVSCDHTYYSEISGKVSLFDKIKKAWEAITTGYIFTDLTRDESDKRCKQLDLYHRAFEDEDDIFTKLTRG